MSVYCVICAYFSSVMAKFPLVCPSSPAVNVNKVYKFLTAVNYRALLGIGTVYCD